MTRAPLARLLRRLRRLRRDEAGSVSLEAMIALPMLVWAYLGSFVFFDAFHAEAVNVKAAYTIGDVLSREHGYVTPEYMDSLAALLDHLVAEDVPQRLRVTAFRLEDGAHEVVWSQVRGGGEPLDTADMAALKPRIPLMSEADVAVLTETWVDHRPAFEGIIDPFTYEDFVVTRPRVGFGKLCWNSLNDGGVDTQVC